MRALVLHPDARLRDKSAPVTAFTPALRDLAEQMLTTMTVSAGFGLAAIQIGEPIRLVTLACGGDLPRVVVNPEVLWRNVRQREHHEGCLSIPGVYATLKRSAEVRIRYQDLDGESHVALFREKAATCIQHEMDHLDGKLFLDRLSRREREAALAEGRERRGRDLVLEDDARILRVA